MGEHGRLLMPKSNWAIRKVVTWLFLGPFNPACWVAIYVFDEHQSLFGLVAIVTLWPCCFGASISLLRLKNRPLTVDDLLGFVAGWALLVSILYPITLFSAGALYFQILESGGFEVAHLSGVFLWFVLGVLALPFALSIACLPALWAGMMSYVTVRWLLFERSSLQVAKPSPCLVANSER